MSVQAITSVSRDAHLTPRQEGFVSRPLSKPGSAASAGREPFAGYVTDAETRAVVARFVEDQGWSSRSVQKGGIASAARTLWVAPPPEILLVDLSDSTAPLEEIETLEQAFRRNSRVIALGTSNDVMLYRRLIEAGVADYLVKPIHMDDLERALRLTARIPVDVSTVDGRAIGVVGARGGVGATTVATNLAWAAAERFQRRSVLLDLDLQFGSAALALDLQVGGGLREALEEPERIDELFLDRALVHLSDTLSILAAEEQLDRTVSVDPEATVALTMALKERTDALVLDVPAHDPTVMSAVAPLAQDWLVVTELTLTGLRDTTRLLRLLEDTAPASRTSVVANRVPRGAPPVPRREFEQELRRPIDVVLAAEDRVAAEAANAGRPIGAIAPSGRLARAIDGLAGQLLDAETKPRGFLARFKAVR